MSGSTSKERFQRVDQLFRAASGMSIEQREAFLAQSCADESSIRKQVLDMLHADAQAQTGVLDRPAFGDSVSVSNISFDPPAPRPCPERIGRYRILRVIGEGGMGTVYEAEQENPRRHVALKVLRHATTNAHQLQRFQQEAQILGRLQHPGIAQILEAGTTDAGEGAQPFLVMELVRGRPLLDHSRHHNLTVQQRLELVAMLCDAIHYAHQNGVVHRDLKPGNILVIDDASENSDMALLGNLKAQTKILDFGVARITDADVRTVTVHTTVGELIGTVPYMSPEQAAGDPALLDSRSDVYALGVIMYELLTGRLPQDVRHLMVHEAVRIIREDDPTPAGSVDRMFRGDIETILSKALEKDRSRRYQTAAALATDIRRHLNEQPISARPASMLYRMSKFTRRNKAMVAGVGIAFAAMMVGTAVAVRQALVAEHARTQERKLREVADERTAEAERHAYRASVVAASSALRYHEAAEAIRHLEAAPVQLRGWEWDHLHSKTDHSLMHLNVGRGTTAGIAINSDGTMLATGNSAGIVSTWSIPDMTLHGEYRIEGSVLQRRIIDLQFSSDGSELRVDASQGSVRLDTATMSFIARDEALAVVRSPNGAFAASTHKLKDETGWMRIFEVASDRELFRLDGNEVMTSFASFSHDGFTFAVCLRNTDGLLIYRTQEGQLLCRRPDLKQVTDIVFSQDASRIAISGSDGEARVIDAKTGSDIVVLKGHVAAVTAIAFNDDESLIATTSNDHTVRLWRSDDGAQISVMHGNQSPVVGMAFSIALPDMPPSFVTICRDFSVRWWDATMTGDPFVLPTSGTVYDVAISPDGKKIVAACLEGERPLRIWNAANGQELLATSEGNLSALAINADGTQLAVGRSTTSETSILTFEGSEVVSFPGHWWRTDWVAFSKRGDTLWSLGNGGRLIKHDLESGESTRIASFTTEVAGEGCRASMNHDESIIAVASRTDISLIDLQTLEQTGSMTGHTNNIYALAFSPDGKRLVSGAADRLLQVWDVNTQQSIATMTGHSAEVYAVVFSPDGTRIFSGGRDGVIRIWDATTFNEITQLHGHTSLVYCLAISPDGRTLVSGGGDDTVRRWMLSPLRDQRRKHGSD